MRQKSIPVRDPAERVVKDIRRAMRRHFSAEDKIRIVLEGLRGEDSIAELCRREGMVVDAGLASGTAGLELIGGLDDLELGSAPGVAVLGVWGLGTGCVGALSLRLGAGLGARRKSEHRSQGSDAQEMPMSQES